MIRVRGNSRLSREIVCGTQRNNAERSVVTIETVHDLVERSVAAHSRDHVDALARRGAGKRLCVARLERNAHLGAMATLAHPFHEMAKIGAIGSSPVNHEGDVFVSGHFCCWP